MNSPSSPLAAPRSRRGLTLLESGRSLSARRALSVCGGMSVHLVTMAGAVVLLSLEYRGAESSEQMLRAVYLAPDNKATASVSEERLLYAGLAGNAELAPAEEQTSDGAGSTEVPVPGGGGGGDGNDVVDEAEQLEMSALEDIALSIVEVDSVVTPDPNSAGPEYPERLLRARVEGAVLARFIVDSTGRADPVSFIAVQTSDTAFTSAVRRALPGMKFSPATLRGVPVAQVVVQQFTFRVASLPGDTLPMDTLSGDTLPGKVRPGDTLPADVRSGDTVPTRRAPTERATPSTMPPRALR